MKRLFCLLCATVLLLTGCTSAPPEKKQYTASFLTLFDTVTTIVGRADSEAEFTAAAQAVHDELLEYHQLFDIYNEYEGLVNLKTVNDRAGIEPVTVDGRILRLLADCKEFYSATNGMVNVAMGSVLRLWHEARTDGLNDPLNAKLPDEEALKQAAAHRELDHVVLDETASTIFFTDPQLKLDVGAIAKGWSAQQVAQTAPSGLLISVGGNVCATGPKDENGAPWVVGIQNVDGSEDYLHTLYVTEGCVVTSGDYQRNYMVDGKLYHHIIDPNTLYPSTLWCSVSVVCPDSGAADALSTALFLLPQTEGQALLEHYHAEAMWVDGEGRVLYSPGFRELIRT